MHVYTGFYNRIRTEYASRVDKGDMLRAIYYPEIALYTMLLSS